MATELENRSLRPRHRQLLSVLAKAPRGRDVNALLSRGFRFDTIADLIRGGLATVQLRSTGKREPNVDVACVRITDAGRRALESAGESI
jgi:thiamine monophosphate synthase